MRGHRPGRVAAVLTIVGVLALVVAHGAVLFYGASRVRLPAAIVAGVVGLVVIKHLGIAGRLRDLIRRSSERTGPR